MSMYDPKPLPKRALIAVTSAHKPLYPDNKETGLFITEALHPYNVFVDAGLQVDFVSETGTYQPDWLSQQDKWLNGEDKAAWEGSKGDFKAKLDKLYTAGDVDPDQVSLSFISKYGDRRVLERLNLEHLPRIMLRQSQFC